MGEDRLRLILIAIAAGYFVLINLAGFLLMWVDKRKAQKGRWRIPESTLFLVALLGGSLGCILGMYRFRHKTKHLKFVIGLPTILIAEAALLIWIL